MRLNRISLTVVLEVAWAGLGNRAQPEGGVEKGGVGDQVERGVELGRVRLEHPES